jgi:voltage-gated sodium channel
MKTSPSLEKKLSEAHNDRVSVNRHRRASLIHGGHDRASYFSEDSWLYWMQSRVEATLASGDFDALIGMLIVVNIVLIGVEQNLRLSASDQNNNGFWLEVLEVVDNIFFSIYLIELLARIFVYGIQVFQNKWVKVDALILLVNVIAKLFVSGTNANILRVCRLCRAGRLVVKFRELYLLLHGLVASAPTMFYTMVLLLLILYVFACIGIEVVRFHPSYKTDATFFAIVEKNFSSLGVTLLTLVQFVAMDNVAAIYSPLIKADWTLAFYFMLIIIFVPIVVMNIITAVMVNSAMENAEYDREAQKQVEENRRKKLVKILDVHFEEMDADGSGNISLEELEHAGYEVHDLLRQLTHLDNVNAIFTELNVKDQVALSREEFCEGVLNIASSANPELRRIERKVDRLVGLLEELAPKVEFLYKVATVPGFEADQASLRTAQQAERTAQQVAAEAPAKSTAVESPLHPLSQPQMNSCFLKVVVNRARNLRHIDVNAEMSREPLNTYVVVSAGFGDTQTHVEGGSDPEWQEACHVMWNGASSLTFEVYYKKSRGGHGILYRASVAPELFAKGCSRVVTLKDGITKDLAEDDASGGPQKEETGFFTTPLLDFCVKSPKLELLKNAAADLLRSKTEKTGIAALVETLTQHEKNSKTGRTRMSTGGPQTTADGAGKPDSPKVLDEPPAWARDMMAEFRAITDQRGTSPAAAKPAPRSRRDPSVVHKDMMTEFLGITEKVQSGISTSTQNHRSTGDESAGAPKQPFAASASLGQDVHDTSKTRKVMTKPAAKTKSGKSTAKPCEEKAPRPPAKGSDEN